MNTQLYQKNDYKARRKIVQEALNREIVATLLFQLGIDITRDFKFADNPSISIRRDGLIHDFGGTSFSGDIVSYMHDVLGHDLNDSLKWVEASLDLEGELQ